MAVKAREYNGMVYARQWPIVALWNVRAWLERGLRYGSLQALRLVRFRLILG
jgi:hypothetical protein